MPILLLSEQNNLNAVRGRGLFVEARRDTIHNMHAGADLVQFLHDRQHFLAAVFCKRSDEILDLIIIALLNGLLRKADDLRFKLQSACERVAGIPAVVFAIKVVHRNVHTTSSLCSIV